MPGALLPGVGFGLIVVVGGFITLADATAELTTPVVTGIAVAGLALGRNRLPMASGWALGAAVAVFAVYAAPIVASGEPTIAGYIKLDDTATWLALTDRVMEHGRSVEGLAPSTYEATLSINLGDGYPIGAFIPFGVGGRLLGTELAWVIQPYMAFLGALLALALWQLAGPVVASARLRAAIAFVAAQPALLYGYHLWGGLKELAAVALVVTAAAAMPLAIEAPRGYRGVALALLSAALVGVLSPGGAVWLVPILAVGAALAWQRFGSRVALRRCAGLGVLVALMCVPVFAAGSLLPPTSLPLTDGDAIGNLAGPLDAMQIAGIWPAGDFRFGPDSSVLTDIAIGVACLGAAVGLAAAWRRRAWDTFVLVVGMLLVALGIGLVGSPWVAGKAMASSSVAVPFAAMLGAAWLWSSGSRTAAALLALVVAGGVLWSNALAYRDASLAPYDQLAELETIGDLIAGEGPTLMTEYSPYGARHFLREADPEAVSELRRREIRLLSGKPAKKGLSADTDRISTPDLLTYRTLVLRRSPAQSRPPSPYRLTWSGDFYEVWQRVAGPPPQLARLGLGSAFDPTGRPSCAQVGGLAAGKSRVIAARRPRPVVLSLADARYPADWRWDEPGSPVPTSAGTVAGSVRVPEAGEYGTWLRGSVKPEATLSVDGEGVGEVRGELNNQGQYLYFGTADLARGRHEIELRLGGADLHPGSGGARSRIGPVVLAHGETPDVAVISLRASRARELCGHRWDWVEAVTGNAGTP